MGLEIVETLQRRNVETKEQELIPGRLLTLKGAFVWNLEF
jgi:hypothetical protein